MKNWLGKMINRRFAGRSLAVLMALLLVVQSAGACGGRVSAAAADLVTNGGFEQAKTTADATMQKYFKNGIVPTGWESIWVPVAPADASADQFDFDTAQAAEGKQSLHYHATEKARIDILQVCGGVNPAKSYLFTGKLKTQNVAGGSVYFRIQALDAANKTVTAYGSQVVKNLRGTSDGWVECPFLIQNLPSNVTQIKVELFMDNVTGECWADDVHLTENYSLSFAQSAVTLQKGEQRQLTPQLSAGATMPALQWSSSDPTVAAVDATGLVTAQSAGTAVITAKADDLHQAACSVVIDDPALAAQYLDIVHRWQQRLTGNDISDTSDADYQALMIQAADDAETIWQSMHNTGDPATLWDDLNLTVQYQAKNSNAALTVDFNTAFSRIRTMAYAYAAKGSRLYHNTQLKNDILFALSWMHTHVYNESYDTHNKIYGNWWHWFIGIPKELGFTLFLMYDDVPSDLMQEEVATLDNFNEDPNYVYNVYGTKNTMTSANLMDTAMVAVMKGALGRNLQALGQARAAISTALPYVTSGDGFYADGSCIQHTNLAYTGAYGSTLLTGMENILFSLNDTTAAVTDPQLANVYSWILDGYRPLFAYGAIMDMVSGRSVARPARTDITAGRSILVPIVHLAATASESSKAAIMAFAKEQIGYGLAYCGSSYYSGMSVSDLVDIKNLMNDASVPANTDATYYKVFGSMDKVADRTGSYTVGLSMYSSRTGSFEFGNGENLKGWDTANGALSLYTGDQSQYTDSYWPTVDPTRLAGTTTDHIEGTISTTWNAHVSDRSFVGGSSALGKYGSAVMDFAEENSSLSALKSWFFFGDQIACLGAGIQSDEDRDTETIVENRKIRDTGDNQLLLNGEAFTGQSAGVSDVKWAYLDGNTGKDSIGYYFPTATSLNVLREARTGSWADINSTIAAGTAQAAPITKNYVSLAVDHGSHPSGAAYSYVLLPNRSAEQVKSYAQNPEITILSNTSAVQAVYDKSEGVTGVNFRSPATVDNVTAANPLSLTMAEQNGQIAIGVSDPSQQSDTVSFTLKGGYSVVSADSTVSAQPADDGLTVTVRTKGTAGASQSLVISRLAAQVTGVSVTPGSVALGHGDTQAFTADVTGINLDAASSGVAWSVAGNQSSGTAIDSDGRLTVASDESAAALTVTATSICDNSKYALATVAIRTGDQTGFTFPDPSIPKAVGDADFTVSASGGQGNGAVHYAVTSGGDVISLCGNRVSVKKAGTAVVMATKAADGSFRETTAALTIRVGKGTPLITETPAASQIAVTGLLSDTPLSGGSASVAGTFAWTNPAVKVSAPGGYSVTFLPTDTDDYTPVTCTVPVTVCKQITNTTTGVLADMSGCVLPDDVTAVTLADLPQTEDSAAYSAVVQLVNGDQSLGSLKKLSVYNLRLLDQAGRSVDGFTGKVQVKIPIPQGMSGNLHVFWYDPSAGQLTDMGATQQGEYLVFDTTHFSYYAVAELDAAPHSLGSGSDGSPSPSIPNPKTGSKRWPFIPLAVLGGMVAAGAIGMRRWAKYGIRRKSK